MYTVREASVFGKRGQGITLLTLWSLKVTLRCDWLISLKLEVVRSLQGTYGHGDEDEDWSCDRFIHVSIKCLTNIDTVLETHLGHLNSHTITP